MPWPDKAFASAEEPGFPPALEAKVAQSDALLDNGPVRPGDLAGMARRLAVAELAHGIAHELQNQLTVVATSIQLARQCPDRGEALLDQAWRSAMRAARVMAEMVQYAQGRPLPGTGADVADALGTAVAAAWADCRVRGVRLEMRLSSGLPSVRGSDPAVRVLLLHLLRWGARRCQPGWRLLAMAERSSRGVAVRLAVADPGDREAPLAWPAAALGPDDEGATRADQAVLEALANELGVMITAEPGVRLDLPSTAAD